MRFTFSQISMSRGLQKVMGAVSTRVPMPSLSNLLMKLEGNKLEITATDLEITVTANVEVIESEGSGGFLIQAKRFQELIRELPDVPLEVDVPEAGKVFLSGEGIGRYTLPSGDQDDFPDIPPVDPEITFKLHAEDLKRMVSKTIFAVSHDEMRPVLTGILLQVHPGEIRMVTTDGHRLSRIIKKGIEYDGEVAEVIIPMKGMNILLRNLEADDVPEITLSENKASFSTDHHRLITRLIDGRYPQYESVIPENNPSLMTVNTSDLMTNVRRVSIFASQLSKQIRLNIQNESIKMESEDQDIGGKGAEEVAVSYNGESMETAYNATYLMDVLKQVDTEEAMFELGSFDDAAIIKPTVQEEDEDFLMLLMPIRLK